VCRRGWTGDRLGVSGCGSGQGERVDGMKRVRKNSWEKKNGFEHRRRRNSEGCESREKR
jgi:hypothetical protein